MDSDELWATGCDEQELNGVKEGHNDFILEYEKLTAAERRTDFLA